MGELTEKGSLEANPLGSNSCDGHRNPVITDALTTIPTATEPPKSIGAFLASEKGGITKKSLVDSAVAAGFVFALSQAVSAQVIHSNSLTLTGVQNPQIVGKHTHHSSHSSHSYHSSY